MNPFDRVHQQIVSGKVLGSDGSWISRTEALKEKRALLQHVLGGEVKINDTWTRLSDINPGMANVVQPEYTTSPPSPPLPVRREFEKETAVMPPPSFDREIIRKGQENGNARFVPPKLPTPIQSDAVPAVLDPSIEEEDTGFEPTAQSHPEFKVTGAGKSSFLSPNDPATDNATYIQPEILREPGQAPQSTPIVPPAGSAPPPRFLPPQKLEMTASQKTVEGGEHPNKDTITIRTIPLGKEASLTISESRAAGALIAVCSVEGFIDQSNSDKFNHQLMSMLEFGVRFFIIDFERTVLVGSAGWGVLAVAARMIKLSGGRLLTCNMKPEIEESFHLLQFGDVIDACTTLNDSIETLRAIIENQAAAVQPHGDGPMDSRYGESFAELPLPEKILSIISRNGPSSLPQIAAHLNEDRYGKVKIGLIKLYFLLKNLNLETNWKRVRYYRSC